MSEMIEQWRDIKGYEGLYQVSNLGRVKSLNYNHTGKVKVLKNCSQEDGYLKINLYLNGKRKNFKIHRLVAETFIPSPNNLPFVNHKDEDKTNNCLENLEFCTQEYNNNYGTRTKRMAEKMKGRKHTDETRRKISESCKISVSQYNKTGFIIKVYPSAKDAQMDTGINSSSITKCCKGKYKTSGGYIWRYTN